MFETPVPLIALLLMEAQQSGDLKQKTVTLKVTPEEWFDLLGWRAQASEASQVNIPLNKLLRMSLRHQASGMELACPAPIQGNGRRRRVDQSDSLKRISLTMDLALLAHLNDLCARCGGSQSQVVYACAALLMLQVAQLKQARSPRKRRLKTVNMV